MTTHPVVVPLSEHLWRFGYALVGKWSPDYDPNDKPPKSYRSYLGEIGHSGKNVIVEWLRAKHWWNRGDKRKPGLPYEWPEY